MITQPKQGKNKICALYSLGLGYAKIDDNAYGNNAVKCQ